MNDNKMSILTYLAAAGDPNAMLEWADYYYYHQNKQDLSADRFQTVFDYYTLSANAGNDHAMTALGSMYYEGINLSQDFRQAKCWFEKAAEKGNAVAINYLGYCYYYGRDIPRDFERAYYFFCKAAQMGHHNGMYKLGDLYYNGHFVKKDPAIAFYWYHQAKNAVAATSPEYPNISYRLGHCYLTGDGVAKDLLLALEWLHTAESGCYRLICKGDAYAELTLVRIKEDLETLHGQLDAPSDYRHADLGYHNPLKMPGSDA